MPRDTTPVEETPVEPARKSRKPLLLIVVALVVLAAAGIGGYMFMHHGEPATAETAKKAEYYALDPSIVVNFQDDRAIRFLQVGISLMSYDPKAIEAAKAAEPRIRNALLLLFSSQKYANLSTEQGKLALQQEALKDVQDVVQQSLGRPGIDAVYFTSFVIQ